MMTGTSLDGLDAAVIEIHGHALNITAQFLCGTSIELGPCAKGLHRLANGTPLTAREIAQLRCELARRHAAAASDLMTITDNISFLAVHGQTVLHAPPLTWQLIDATTLAHMVRKPVVFDFRSADVAAGGQGAPITPIADWIMFQCDTESRAIVNLGGFCNVTLLPPSASPNEVSGFDVCACNQLLDACAQAALNQPFDHDGAAASQGTVHTEALTALTAILQSQRTSQRSLGTGDEANTWARHWNALLPANDLCRTCCEAVGACISQTLRHVQRVAFAGGGAKNRALLHAIQYHIKPTPTVLTNSLGVPGEYREAAAMAVLGALTHDRIATTFPNVTGRNENILLGGTWVYP